VTPAPFAVCRQTAARSPRSEPAGMFTMSLCVVLVVMENLWCVGYLLVSVTERSRYCKRFKVNFL
jgi:hypothetical protein